MLGDAKPSRVAPDDAETLRTLAVYADGVSSASSPSVAFQLAEQTSQRLIGCRLFTVMQFNPATMEVKRVYSSDPESYPAGGSKKKRETEWGAKVLENGCAFIGYDADDIRRYFDDHELIAELGLASVLNMPVRLLGKTVGTMNLLDEAGYYTEDDLGTASIIANGLAAILVKLNGSQ